MNKPCGKMTLFLKDEGIEADDNSEMPKGYYEDPDFQLSINLGGENDSQAEKKYLNTIVSLPLSQEHVSTLLELKELTDSKSGDAPNLYDRMISLMSRVALVSFESGKEYQVFDDTASANYSLEEVRERIEQIFKNTF